MTLFMLLLCYLAGLHVQAARAAGAERAVPTPSGLCPCCFAPQFQVIPDLMPVCAFFLQVESASIVRALACLLHCHVLSCCFRSVQGCTSRPSIDT